MQTGSSGLSSATKELFESEDLSTRQTSYNADKEKTECENERREVVIEIVTTPLPVTFICARYEKRTHKEHEKSHEQNIGTIGALRLSSDKVKDQLSDSRPHDAKKKSAKQKSDIIERRPSESRILTCSKKNSQRSEVKNAKHYAADTPADGFFQLSTPTIF